MKTFGLMIAVVLMLGAQSPAAGSKCHLVYEFGYNTKVASSGNGTGTTTIDIGGTAPDGGVMISGKTTGGTRLARGQRILARFIRTAASRASSARTRSRRCS